MELIVILIFIAPSWAFAFLYLMFGIRPHLNSAELATLNLNLAKIGQYWSNNDGDFRPLSDGAIAADREKLIRTFLIMTALLSLLSLIGMLLLIALFVSGRPRLEMNTFKTDLVKRSDLSAAQVKDLVEELRGFI